MVSSTIMPVIAALFVLVIIVTVIVVAGGIIGRRQYTVNQKSFETLAEELRKENAAIRSELSGIKEKVSSMDRMMNDI